MSFLQMSLSAGIMIIVIIVVRALAINRLPKKTFLVLWGLALARLLLPFSFQSPFSVYSFVNRTGMAEPITNYPLENNPSVNISQVVGNTPGNIPNTHISLLSFIWLLGLVLCVLYFTISYVKYRREFIGSFPLENDFISEWFKSHKLKRQIEIRQSSRIKAPLTYGILHPVILMPKQTVWTDTKKLQYVLQHEYVHIRRFDSVTKILLTICLCVHWFNPLAWAMYILANRDLELSCDEAVVHSFGDTIKSAYAMALISMEEHKSGLMPFTNSFSRNAIEERIRAIMKMKKTTIFSTVAAITVILSIATGFATSASAVAPANADKPSTGQKVEISHDGEYANWGIRVKDGIYYYQDDRIRIFMDLRADDSFEKFFTDSLGTIDIRLVRNSEGSVVRVERISKEDAQEIIDDIGDSPSGQNISSSNPSSEATIPSAKENVSISKQNELMRIAKDDLPSNVLSTLNDCTSIGWYMIEDTHTRYIYYNGLPFNFAYQYEPGEPKANIVDFGSKRGNYVLLAMPKTLNLTLTYNAKPISFTNVTVK